MFNIAEVRHINDGTVNKNRVILTDNNGQSLTLYFSYETIIAFRFNGQTFCSTNDWSKTTGKYLDEIEPDKANRIPHSELLNKLNNALTDHRPTPNSL